MRMLCCYVFILHLYMELLSHVPNFVFHSMQYVLTVKEFAFPTVFQRCVLETHLHCVPYHSFFIITHYYVLLKLRVVI